MSSTTEQSTQRRDASAHDRRQSGAVWPLVAKREIMVKLRDKAFIGGTLLSLAIIVGVFGFQAWNAERDRTYDIAVTSESTQMGQTVREAAPTIDDAVTVELVEVSDDAAARAALDEGEADAWLHPGDAGWVLASTSQVSSQLLAVVQPTVTQSVLESNAEAAGTDVAALQQGSEVTTELLEGDEDRRGLAQAAGIVMAILFYMSAMLFGMTLASSVVEEKQSRIAEIIAASIPTRQLLIGKLVGNVALALGQLAIYVAVGLIGLSFTDLGGLLPSLSAGLLWFLVYFLVGFTCVAALFAVAGALASRTEDVQSTATPVTMLVLIMFFGSFFVGESARAVMAWIPPFSAIAMPVEVVAGEATWWEAVLALIPLIALTALVLWAAERIYRRALLQTGGKLGYRQAWRAEV